MGTRITCSRCGQNTLLEKRHCEYCGVDLAMAAVLAEQEVDIPVRIPVGTPISPEILVPKIGQAMIQEGLISREELQLALDLQKNRAKRGDSILLGQAMLELDLIDREKLDQVITSQIFKLQNALSSANQQLAQRVEERTRELKNALDRLSELNQLKSNFIANISHELRTPLTHIKGYLDLLSDGGLGSLNQDQTEALEVIKKSEDRLERLIEDLIQFSMASRGEINLNLSMIPIDRLINHTIDRSQRKAQTKGISISAQVPDNLPNVRADEEKLGWVMGELLDNAIKFTDAGGKAAVKASFENGLVSVAFMDTGIGIPEDRIPEIFEPFHQLDGNTNRRFEGTGLGLALVRRIIEAHGSQVKVDSIEHKGTRIEFSLPGVKQNLHPSGRKYERSK